MDYCIKGQFVFIPATGQVGMVETIICRRTAVRDGVVMVQCGAGGPFVKANMKDLMECSEHDYKEAMGLI